MKAMILAAGKGTRVQPLTYELPKPMIPVPGRPVMEYIVEHLARHGVTDIMVNLSHLGYRIEQFFGDGRRFGVNIGYSFEGSLANGEIVPKPLGSAGALRKIQDFGSFFDETTLVLCGDVIIDLDITRAAARHREQRALVTVIAAEVPREAVSSYGVIESDGAGRVVSFQEKSTPAQARSNGVSTGIYVFEPEAVAMIPPERTFDIGGEYFPMLVRERGRVFCQKHAFNWIDIGKVSDYWEVVMRLMREPAAGAVIPGREVKPRVFAGLNTRIAWEAVEINGPVYVGAGTRIDPGCRINGPVWIGHGCHIESGAEVARSVLFDYTCVKGGSRIADMVLSGRYGVSRWGETFGDPEALPMQRWGDARSRTVNSRCVVA